MEEYQGKVSVIVPAYNAEATLSRCITSIFDQTYAPFEVLIYDDCSSDGTGALAHELAREHPRIRVFAGEFNRGAGYARTKLLREVKGDIIAFLDSDDTWAPTKLEKQIRKMLECDLDICVCGYEVRDSNNQHVGVRRAPHRITWFSMHLANWIPTSMAIIRANLEGSRMMPDIRRRQDYAYWLTLFKENKQLRAGGVDEILGTYYRSSTGLSSSRMNNLKANYHMFTRTLKYSAALSGFCVLLNIVIRIFRK